MKSKSKQLAFRILFILLIVLVFVFTKYYHCIVLEFAAIPSILNLKNGVDNIYILYGEGLCGSCPAGRRILREQGKQSRTFIVPTDFSDQDILNMKDAFSINGRVMRGDAEIVDYLKKIAVCRKINDWQINVLLEYTEAGTISKIIEF